MKLLSRKNKVKELLKVSLEINGFMKKYKPEKILTMNKKELISLLYEFMEYNNNMEFMKSLIIKDIVDNLYLLEGNEINFSWKETIIYENVFNMPFRIPQTINHNESYVVRDFRLFEPITTHDKLNNKMACNLKPTNFETFNPDKLDKFYLEIMKQCNIESIYDKLGKVSKLL